jgi:hypothetical protein
VFHPSSLSNTLRVELRLTRYAYFEKVRIFEGKKKTAKRERNELEQRQGFSLTDRARRGVWVLGR